jgi:hypothetical protein
MREGRKEKTEEKKNNEEYMVITALVYETYGKKLQVEFRRPQFSLAHSLIHFNWDQCANHTKIQRCRIPTVY